ncbi:MAG TPA: Gfo/Idh/MocA family oxidoreductase [Candidatus Dormibacteraeota bacterium]|nr:Gfo/Idh/MocA family oxidoreductase [Candidatus Dormibacteraeota bacterium]
MSAGTPPLRVGLVGAGRHASTSLHPALRPAGLEPVAVCTRHLEQAQAAARRLGAERAHDDVGAMLDAGGLDAVVVCVPPDAYAPIVRRCVEAGLPVFTEKPGAANAAEARTLAAFAAERRVPVMVGFMKRFAPTYRRAREIARSEEFGGLRMASLKFVVGRMRLPLDEYVVENVCHPLDLARFLAGEVAELSAEHSGDGERGHALAILARTATGALLTFQVGTVGAWSQHNERVELYGGGASVCVDNLDTLIHRPAHGPTQVSLPNYTVPLPANFTGTTMGFVPELEHFRAVAGGGVACESDMAGAAATLELAARVVAAAGAPR